MKVKYTLSEQAQLCVISLFQKGLVTMKDMSEILTNLEFKFDGDGKLEVLNPETCQLTDEDLEEAELMFTKQEKVLA